jgi:hypothetical protein
MKPVIDAARLLRAEFTRFRTVRGWMIALCATAVVFVLVSFFSAFESRSGNSVVPTGPGGEAVTDTYTFVHQELAGDGTLLARVTSLMSLNGSAYGRLGAWWPPAGEHFRSQGLEPYRKTVPLPAAGRVDRCWDVVRADGVSTVSLGR